MNATIAAWLPDVVSDSITIDLNDVTAEARENLWAFSVTSSEAAQMTVRDLEDFISAVTRARGDLLTHDGYPPGAMIFYCWFDEMACQLRFSIVSANGDPLPFGCAIIGAPLEQILAAFLTSKFHDGIPWSELSFSDSSNSSPPPPKLAVWCVSIP